MKHGDHSIRLFLTSQFPSSLPVNYENRNSIGIINIRIEKQEECIHYEIQKKEQTPLPSDLESVITGLEKKSIR